MEVELLSKTITVFGLFLNVIGTVFLAYDIFYNPGKIFRLEMYDRWIAEERRVRDCITQQNKNLSQPPYTKKEIQNFIQENNAHCNKKIKNIKKEKDNLKNEYPEKVFKWGSKGILLIIAGFMFQIIGLIWS